MRTLVIWATTNDYGCHVDRTCPKLRTAYDENPFCAFCPFAMMCKFVISNR
jgi:hypothetical protein